MVRVHENRRRRAARTDLLQNLRIRELRKTMTAVLSRRGHSENPDPSQTVDHIARNVGLSIDLRRIELRVQKGAQFFQRLIELCLLGLRDPRIRHHPVGNEMPLKKSFNKAKRLRTGEQQFLGLLHFLLPLNLSFSSHRKIKTAVGKTAVTNCSCTRSVCPITRVARS